MKFYNKIVNGIVATTLMLLLVAFVAAPTVNAIPYGNDAPPTPTPTFNAYTGVPDVGNESDFHRVRVDGSSADPVSDLSSSCETGKKFQFRIYVHNGASQYKNDNGNGPSVAKNTKVKVNLDNATNKSAFATTATLSASNAASITDGATIRCNDGKVVKLSYVAGSAQQYNPGSGVQNLSDSIVTTGAPIGTNAPDGNLWGCWDQRVWVRLVVEVKEVVVPPVSTAACKLDNGAFVVTDDRRVTVKVNAEVKNATVEGYEINWGDGSAVSNKQEDTHQYPTDKDGTYNIQTRVKVKLADGTVKWVDGDDCAKTVKFAAGKPPVVPPVTPVTPPSGKLPDTGAGANLFGIFATVSMVGAYLHKAYKARKASV